MTTKKEIRHDAQREIMVAATTVFYRIGDNQADYPPDLITEIRKQMERIEKLFGYVPGSWSACVVDQPYSGKNI